MISKCGAGSVIFKIITRSGTIPLQSRRDSSPNIRIGVQSNMAKRNWTDEQLIEAVKKFRSVSQVLEHLGVKSRATVMRRIQQLELDTSRLERISSGLKLDHTPNAHWRKFKERLDNYDQTPPSQWTKEHILGHILKRYKDVVGVEFAISYSGPPTKCKEIFCIRRVLLRLGTEDGEIAKRYVDWVFDTIIIPQKVTISSVAYFLASNLVLKFKAELRRQSRITRATELPESFREVASNLSLDVKTYGDLAFAKVAIEDDPENDELKAYFDLFMHLKEAGFDDTVLSSLEG
jgi:hypothetical protein